MNHTISIGPLVLPMSLLAVLLAVALGVAVARVTTRKLSTDVGPMLWQVGVAALLASTHPDATPKQLTQLLDSQADPIACPAASS